ncbi:MAG: enoyl-CoA hydratase-related protein [Novosphingobium sp.]|nr:enoyl-CoA hydratase-related protein [Novosphingobium sp.]
MEEDPILQDERDGVLTLTLNRPAKLNAITPDMQFGLHDAFERFARSDHLQVCVVTGAGERAFCAGSDLTAQAEGRSAPYPPSGYGGIAARFDLDKPVIAAVNGLCLGGGFEIALACDIIVASANAVFGLPEPKVGVIAVGGGIHRLARQIGLKQAMEALLTARNIPAEEGYRLGFVSRLAEPDTLDETVSEICAQILANAPLAVRLTKELANWGLDQPTLADAMEGQTDHPSFKHWLASEDTAEGPRAFAEKRKPVWKGK